MKTMFGHGWKHVHISVFSSVAKTIQFESEETQMYSALNAAGSTQDN